MAIIMNQLRSNKELVIQPMILKLEKEGSRFPLTTEKEKSISNKELAESQYIIIRLENTTDETLTLEFDFYAGHSEAELDKLSIAFDILPRTDVTIPIHLDYLNSQILFPPRTQGRLRMMVSGKPLSKENITAVFLKSRPFYKDREIVLKSLYLSNEEKAEIHSPKALIDELGQWKLKEWPRKVSNRDALNRLLKGKLEQSEQVKDDSASVQGSPFGGIRDIQLTKTGWFHTEKVDEKWWLVDPEGYAFISSGIDCINPGADTRVDVMKPYLVETLTDLGADLNVKKFDFNINNLKEAFGEENWWHSWAKITKSYLKKWGINTIGNWSSIEFIKWAKMPYVLPLDAFAQEGFPKTDQTLFRDFPDVFSEQYRINSRKYAKALEPFKEDVNLIGYFMRNEPEWGFVYGLNIAEEMLANPNESASKEAFIERMRDKYKTVEAFNKSWRLNLEDFSNLLNPLPNATRFSQEAKEDLEDFSKTLIRLYVEIPAKACRQIDAYHMNLGMRYSYVASDLMLSGSEFFDVFSINCYQETPLDKIEEITKIVDLPIMIGEFHFGATDQGLTATGIKAVTNQQERGVAYQYYMETAATHSHFVGAHFFQLTDQSCLGRFDGENYQIGFLDCCLQEYQEMTDYVRQTQETLGSIHNGKMAPTVRKALTIPPLSFVEIREFLIQ